MFELHEKYTIAVPVGTISESGIRLIRNWIADQRLESDEWQEKNPNQVGTFLPPLPQEWIYEWVVTGRGEYVGTFPKRVSKYYYQEHGLKCPPTFLSELGNIARQNTETQSEYRFDFTDTFNWRSGEFGDGGSCFWGGRRYALQMLEDNDALAIRFYDNEGKGYARAWLVPITNGRYVIFNGYGFQSNATLRIARIFADFVGLNYKKITLTNQGNDSGTLWVNGSRGYLIGTPDQLEGITRYDFQWEGNGETCYDCGESFPEDEMYTDNDGDWFCEHCFYERYTSCDECGETTPRDDAYYIGNAGIEVCEYCYDRHFNRCDACEEDYRNEDFTSVGDELYCQGCFEVIFTTCEKCETLYRTREGHTCKP